MTQLPAAVYSPFAPGFREDPYPQLARLRAEDPVHWSEYGYCWVLTRYDDIKQVLADPTCLIALEVLEQSPSVRRILQEPYNRIIRGQILASDPPSHTRIRNLLARGFSTSRLDQLRPVIQRCVDHCIDRALEQGGLDLIAGFAYRMPFLVICEIMGIPESERDPLEGYTRGLMRSTDPTPMSPLELARCNHDTQEFRNYFLTLAARRAKRVPENVFDELVAACNEDKLSWDELVANCILLFNAGHDTVVNLFGNGLLALFRNPDQLALLRQEPGLIKGAIEELLRFDTSVTIARRTATETFSLRGRTIHKGHYMLCLLNAGNRDPEVFEDPDRLDVRRKGVKTLSFGGGIHHCLGAQLARLEGQIGLTSLFERIPDLTLETLDPPWSQNVFIRGLEELPARCAGHGGKLRRTPSRANLVQADEGAIAWLKNDARTTFFTYALQYLNWERVEGDILEFGVANGKSLALLSRLYHENVQTWGYADEACTTRRFAGYDSLEGLPDGGKPHPRWSAGSFATNYLHGHPAMTFDEPITAEGLRKLFKVCGLPRPELEVGWFDRTIPATIPDKYQQVALLHIDSDLYSSARCVLEGVAPILSDGALVCFDDWFMYRGDPNEGEARALREFLADHPEWLAVHYQAYSVFCNSFILRRR